MSDAALYTDLSGYYDLMCADIDYPAQSAMVQRLDRLFGNGGQRHLDLACGTGPHIRRFLDAGYVCSGLDIHGPMLDLARLRCPEAQFLQGDMAALEAGSAYDLITCFLYSLHYNPTRLQLERCVAGVHRALSPQGVFCFNLVDCTRIDNRLFVQHGVEHEGSQLHFRSGWHYPGAGEGQSLRLQIDKTTAGKTETWQDEHAMVAISISTMQTLLEPLFEVQVLEHDYQRIAPWDQQSGNALFVCVKR